MSESRATWLFLGAWLTGFGVAVAPTLTVWLLTGSAVLGILAVGWKVGELLGHFVGGWIAAGGTDDIQ